MNNPRPMTPGRRLLRCGVPCVMAAWATVQLITVQTTNLNSWRGGGFGMYAGFHPMHNTAWVDAGDESKVEGFWKNDDHDSGLYPIIRPHLTFPREARLRSDLHEYATTSNKPWSVEITGLEFDLDTLDLSHRRIMYVTTEDQP